MANIAFVTCESKPGITADDQLLATALGWMGWEVNAVPWSTPTDWSLFDIILIRSAWDYHLRSEEFSTWMNRLPLGGKCLMNNPELVRWNMHKRYLVSLQDKGVKIPPTEMLKKGSGKSLRQIMSTQGWKKAVIKPAISATAYQTWTTTMVSDEDERHFDNQLATADMLVQQFIPEITSGELSLMYFGGEFSHAVLKKPKAGDFRVQSDFGGTAEKVEVKPDVTLACKQVIASAPREPLYARVDGVLVNGEFVLMELELIEPHLFFADGPGSSTRLAAKLTALQRAKINNGNEFISDVLDHPPRFKT